MNETRAKLIEACELLRIARVELLIYGAPATSHIATFLNSVGAALDERPVGQDTQ